MQCANETGDNYVTIGVQGKVNIKNLMSAKRVVKAKTMWRLLPVKRYPNLYHLQEVEHLRPGHALLLFDVYRKIAVQYAAFNVAAWYLVVCGLLYRPGSYWYCLRVIP